MKLTSNINLASHFHFFPKLGGKKLKRKENVKKDLTTNYLCFINSKSRILHRNSRICEQSVYDKIF